MPYGTLRDALDNYGQLGGEEFGDYFVIQGPAEVIEKWANKYKSIFRKK